MRTEAPKDLGGRLWRNLDRVANVSSTKPGGGYRRGTILRTHNAAVPMWPGNFSPDDPDLRTTDLLRSPVDEGYLLSCIPPKTISIPCSTSNISLAAVSR